MKLEGGGRAFRRRHLGAMQLPGSHSGMARASTEKPRLASCSCGVLNGAMLISKTPAMVFVIAVALTASGCVHERLTGSPSHYSGRDLYAVYCSGCHGVDGDGVGSVAPYIAVRPPALTGIAAGNGGTFPTEKVFRIIDGQFDSPPPGTRHMPIWGVRPVYRGEDDETAHQQVLDMERRIMRCVESIQDGAVVKR